MEKIPHSARPITPAHSRVIDDVLQQLYTRVQAQAQALGYAPPPPLSLEQMRGSQLGKLLHSIARFAEGYTLPGSILPIIEQVAHILYFKEHSQLWPPNFHRTPFGMMVHEALVRHYPIDRRITASEAAELLAVSRQTIHSWSNDGTLSAIYDQGALTLSRSQVEQLRDRRAQHASEER